MKPLLAGETYQQERLPKFDSHTGIMRILDISFQYSHICKHLPGSRFQALNVFAKQEPLTNKDQPPSLQLAWLNLLEPPPSPPPVSGQPGPYLAREFDVVVPVKHKIQGSVNTELLENLQDSSPRSPRKH